MRDPICWSGTVAEMGDDTIAVREGDELDWRALERHLRAHLDVPAEPMAVRQFGGGRANLTYRLRFGERSLVLRRPPFGTIAPGAHDMRREHRVLSTLWRSYPRAPRALLFGDDESIVGAPFFVMEHRAGVVIRTDVPPAMRHHANVGGRAFLALVDAMADLHRIDPEAAGLGDLGRADGFLARQLAGWDRRWQLVAPSDAPPAMAEVRAILEREIPTPARPSLIHNDLKLDNCQFDPADPDRVTTVFDWDMATVGDPLADVATLLTSSYGADGRPNPSGAAVGIGPRDQALARYAVASGVPLDALAWYEAFACWKTAVVIQQLADRYAHGDAHDDRLASLASGVPVMAERALRLVGR
jgi:aminoglycoside phosphotransferase (APT) family kinase protein